MLFLSALDGVVVADDNRVVMYELWETAIDLTREVLLADWSAILSWLLGVLLVLFVVLAAIGFIGSWLMVIWWERHE